MTNSASRWVVSAAVLLLISLFVLGNQQAALAIDDVLDGVLKIGTARYERTVAHGARPPVKISVSFKGPGRYRYKTSGASVVNLVDVQSGKMTVLDPHRKLAIVSKMNNLPKEARKAAMSNEFEQLRDRVAAAKASGTPNVVDLGEKEINGQTLLGFRFKDDLTTMDVWADSKTKLPYEIVTTYSNTPGRTETARKFEFGIELDDSLFEIPDGYQQTNREMDFAVASESDLVKSLRMHFKNSEGKFPTDISPSWVGVFREDSGFNKPQSNLEQAEIESQFKQTELFKRGVRFVMNLPAASKPHYAGRDHTRDEKGRDIFWYKPQGKSIWRVLDASLNFRDESTAPVVN